MNLKSTCRFVPLQRAVQMPRPMGLMSNDGLTWSLTELNEERGFISLSLIWDKGFVVDDDDDESDKNMIYIKLQLSE